MKKMQVGDLKTHFSEAIERVKKGEKIVVSYGKSRKNIAVIVPYNEFEPGRAIKIGLLKGKAKYAFKKDFAMNAEELTNS